MNWLEYLALAKELAAAANRTDGHRRSAVSRAYYSAYHEAMRYVYDKDPNFQLPRSDKHQAIWNWMQQYEVEQAQIVGATGAGLCALRNDADYRKNAVVNDRTVTTALSEADKIHSKLHDARKRPVLKPQKKR